MFVVRPAPSFVEFWGWYWEWLRPSCFALARATPASNIQTERSNMKSEADWGIIHQLLMTCHTIYYSSSWHCCKWTLWLQRSDRSCLASSLLVWYWASQSASSSSSREILSRYFKYFENSVLGSNLWNPFVWEHSSSDWMSIFTSSGVKHDLEIDLFNDSLLSDCRNILLSNSIKLWGMEYVWEIALLCLEFNFFVIWNPTTLSISVNILSLTCLKKRLAL